jgi:RNA polymerase sigma factor for flagellar operon FliA
MSGQSYDPTPEDLALLDSVIRHVARMRRLEDSDQQDFAQSVHLKLLERNYDVFSKFRGESSLRTYLSAVVVRALLDWRNARYGKWRPSAAAVRLGPEAVGLDRLISRDGYTADQAVEIVSRDTRVSAGALRTLADRLPSRVRRCQVDAGEMPDVASEPFKDPVVARERRERAHRTRRALRRAYLGLSLDDQRLLTLRYKRSMSVREISEDLRTDQKALYRRFERVVSRLRAEIGSRAALDLSASASW